MKNMLCILVFCCGIISNIFAASQRLVVPNLGTVSANSDGVIEMVAYCIDPALAWPENGNTLPYIYSGGDLSIITYRAGGKTIRQSLSKAILAGEVKVTSGRMGTVQIKPAKAGVIIQSINTNGMRVGEQREDLMRQVDDKIAAIVNKHHNNEERYNYASQKKIFDELNKTEKPKHIVHVRSKVPQTWNVWEERGLIKIHEKKSANTHSQKHLKELVNELDEADICVTLDSNWSISVSGSLKGIPIDIEFTSDFEISVSTSIPIVDEKDAIIPVALEVGYSIGGSENTSDKCDISWAATICLPTFWESSYTVNACGQELEISPTGITLDL